MKTIYSYLLNTAIMLQDTIENNMSEWRDEIIKEWEASKSYPRKKKKRVRKSLMISWNLANYNPFQ